MGSAWKRKLLTKVEDKDLKKFMARRRERTWREEAERSARETPILKIASVNIRGGIGTGLKVQELVEYLEECKPDILMVQEAKIKEGDAERLILPEDYEVYASAAEGATDLRHRGVMTIVKRTVASKVCSGDIIKDKEGRILVIPITTLVRGQRLWLINLYAPASQKEASINAYTMN